MKEFCIYNLTTKRDTRSGRGTFSKVNNVFHTIKKKKKPVTLTILKINRKIKQTWKF